MIAQLKRFGETAGYITAIFVVLAGLMRVMGWIFPPWVPAAEGQAIIERLNKADVTQRSIQEEILSQQLSRAWDAYRADPKDESAKAEIWRLTRQLKELDPTIPLPAVP